MICHDYRHLQHECQQDLTEMFFSSFIHFKYCVYFKGEFQSATAPKEAPFSPAPLPPDSESAKMVYVWVTDYLLNTAGLVYQDAGILNETVTPSTVSYFSCNTHWEILVFDNFDDIS